jgi:formylglycine-generating enzyme required for sulfatase activity
MAKYYKLRDAKKNSEGPTEEQAEERDFSGKKSKARVLRGGSWHSPSSGSCRSVYCSSSPSSRGNYIGFRVGVVAGAR